jgi:Methane oxygenase PmoA
MTVPRHVGRVSAAALVCLAVAASHTPAAHGRSGSIATGSAPTFVGTGWTLDEQGVTLTGRPSERRVDVTIGGQPFTSYIYPASLEKPVLYPIRSARGTVVTRGFPLEPRPGERADHPHHVGHWFNYGDVNGYDFWGHSSETPPELRAKAGTIVQKEIVHIESGDARGELAVKADWVVPDGSVVIHEQTRFVFAGDATTRTIDRFTTWTAAGQRLRFADTKEGAFGIRVARALEHPSKEAEVFVSARGEKETVPRLDNTGVTGRYLSSDGTTGDAVWGTRGPWMSLSGIVDGAPVTIAIFDHPSSYGHPTYWHARGYGLFAANPLGRHAFDPKQPPTSLALDPGQSLTFRHRILVCDGTMTRNELQQAYDRFAREP